MFLAKEQVSSYTSIQLHVSQTFETEIESINRMKSCHKNKVETFLIYYQEMEPEGNGRPNSGTGGRIPPGLEEGKRNSSM